LRKVKTVSGINISKEPPEVQDIFTQANGAWLYKPGDLDNLTSSLFDVFDTCFKKHYLNDDNELVPGFLVMNPKDDYEPWTSYREDLLKELQKYLSSRLTKQHQDCVMARFYFYLHHHEILGIPFICNTMLFAVNKQLRACQQALVDVSDITLHWNVDPICLSDPPVVHATSDAAPEFDSWAWRLQIE
jgi:hypothetical protein